MSDLDDDITLWENGELTFEEECHLFQHLLDTGAFSHLQGYYGRHGQQLLDAGFIRERKRA